MTSEIDTISAIQQAALRELAAASDLDSLDAWRIAYLGRRGRLTGVLRGLAGMPIEERRRVGAGANALKERLEAACDERRAALEEARVTQVIQEERLDVTLPGPPLPHGRLHPITQTLRDVLRAFRDMGFQVAEGPEIEWDYYNFEALRIPADHPARDMWDTLWMDFEHDGRRQMLLRTHTSPNQIRVMEHSQPPIRVVVPGKCYRFEATDPTHEWMMTQVEGLAIDAGISMADLKGTLAEFARRIFGQERRVAFRCDYFPFVEPGMELRIDCFICRGEGCRTCGRSGWIEILGAGMVHPEIIANAGYDAEKYTGFAFGLGIERIALLRHGVDDIRYFYANDLRFLRQF
ncbi:MAG: phenylalanine--tRNA ligase subunit alpha [Dehalococcoidia bacterium]|nr:phenylalanine--tRNA ligase subunit alpha [Dehalococcoidia bacterium]